MTALEKILRDHKIPVKASGGETEMLESFGKFLDREREKKLQAKVAELSIGVENAKTELARAVPTAKAYEQATQTMHKYRRKLVRVHNLVRDRKQTEGNEVAIVDDIRTITRKVD